VLYDGGQFSSIQLMDRSIDSTLSGALSNRVTIFREYMDLTRVGPADYERVLCDFYRAKYSSNRPDVIVAVRGRPLDFLLKHGVELFPGVPIVSSAMDPRQVKARKLPPNVTGTSLQVKYWPTLELALALQPQTEQAVVVLGASPNDQVLEALIRDELREHESRLRITYLAGLRLDALTRRLGDLPPRTVVLFASFAQDGDGRAFMPHDAVGLVARAANAPTYINSDDVLDLGAVGGDLIGFAALGRDTADLALRILQGENAADIPFTDSVSRTRTLDARQLERWGIPIALAPSGSIVLNRQPTLWEAYQWWIVGGISLILLQSALITALLLHRKRRRVAEENLRISEANGRAAILEERNRMARDMHDTLAQGFTGVIVQLEAAKQASAHGSSPDMEGHIHRASELARQSLGEARRSIRALRPQALEDADLCVALDSAMKQMTAGTGLQAQFTTRGKPRRLTASGEENLLRIYVEILTNALKHSGAKVIKGTLSFEEDAVRLEVKDDGGGFDLAKEHDGLGLLGIRERVNQMNGKLTVESRVGSGTRICVALPNQARLADGEPH
jgi:signal transduction histidine kinase